MILTIGHSTHPLEVFLEMLQVHGVTMLGDVRTIPRSRHNPQFNSDSLAISLRGSGMNYLHLKQLGGLRHPKADSLNSGWRNASFRGFADYMQTPEFESALGTLIEAADRQQVAIMCAEAVPWRCHRSLIADALTARKIPVAHILSAKPAQAHSLTPFARVEGTLVTYPGLIP